jgi:hypothetical protein
MESLSFKRRLEFIRRNLEHGIDVIIEGTSMDIIAFHILLRSCDGPIADVTIATDALRGAFVGLGDMREISRLITETIASKTSAEEQISFGITPETQCDAILRLQSHERDDSKSCEDDFVFETKRQKIESHLYLVQLVRPGKYKIGQTTKLSRRLAQLGQQSHPPDEQPAFARVWHGRGNLEKLVHERCQKYRMGTSEWFEADLCVLIEVIESTLASQNIQVINEPTSSAAASSCT